MPNREVSVLALAVFCAASIVLHAGAGAGAVLAALFVVWTAGCYGGLFWLAWNGRPRGSVLVVAISRLRGQQHDEHAPDDEIGMGMGIGMGCLAVLK